MFTNHEYMSIRESISPVISHDRKPLPEIITTKEEIIAFIDKCIRTMIPSGELQDKMLANLHDPSFQFETFQTNTSSKSGSCGPIKTEDGWQVEKKAIIGNDLGNGQIKTEIGQIRVILHEIAHASSQKFDIDWMNQSINNPSSREKDSSIGEIESKFIEKLFNGFALNYADELYQANQTFGMDVDSFRKSISWLQQNDNIDFIHDLDNSIAQHDRAYKQRESHRYIIGEIMARILCENYKNNPGQTMDIFEKYMQINAEINIDEASRMLTNNQCRNFGQCVNNFIEYNQNISNKKI